MVLKLMLLSKDENYLMRLKKALESKYEAELELYCFSEPELAYETVENSKIHVLLIDEGLEVDENRLNGKVIYSYLVRKEEVMTKNNKKTVFMYQKIGTFYQQVRDLFIENTKDQLKTYGEGNGSVIQFSSVAGGTGATTAAAAYAVGLAAQGKKVVYISFDPFSSVTGFFDAEGRSTFSDVVFAIKSNRTNLEMKIETYVRQDATGVYYFEDSPNALDVMELDIKEKSDLIEALKTVFDYVVIDEKFSIDKQGISMARNAEQIVLVSNGTESSDIKLKRLFEAINVMGKDMPLADRLSVLFNVNAVNKAPQTFYKPESVRIYSALNKYDYRGDTKSLIRILSKQIIEVMGDRQ